jgi:nucleoside 2-deoxyribosyltransferase
MKIYFAGPDVFRRDAIAHAEVLRRLASTHGHVALLPLDNEANDAVGICAANLAMIRDADAVIANLNPFRGCEPDSGTCFEVGAAVALGKRVVAYVGSGETVRERVRRELGDSDGYDHDGMLIEDFGLPLNLMLAVPCEVVVGGVEEAIERLC